jgi:hypothetical protein
MAQHARRRAGLAAGLALVFCVLAAIRLWGMSRYPVLGPDEGIWNLEARDAALFGDRSMNGFTLVFVAPLHYAISRLWYCLLPATCFSLRILMGLLGVTTLLLLTGALWRRYGARTALVGLFLVGFSFVMITNNRRAYLENGVMVLSLASVVVASSTTRFRSVLLSLCVAAILLYKSNAIYVALALVLPISSGEGRRREFAGRLAAVAGGVLGALVVFLVLSRIDPGAFVASYAFELSKPTDDHAIVRFGRFGIFPEALRRGLQIILLGQTDLVLLTVVGLACFVAGRLWRDDFALRMATWLVGGYVFLLSQWSHVQYFAVLILPAGVLAARGLSRPGMRAAPAVALTAAVALSSVARVAVGWQRAGVSNPPLSAIRWVEQQDLRGGAVLAGPEVAVATEKRAYAFSRIFQPLPPTKPPRLSEFVESHAVRFIVFDEWETAPYYAHDDEFLSELARYAVVATGDRWVAYEVPAGPGCGGGLPPSRPAPAPP